MFLLALLFQGLTAYQAPTSEDAYEAYIAPILADVREAGDVLSEPRLRQARNFPFDITLERCLPRSQRAVRLKNGALARYDGYECLFEVWPNAEPSYRNSGFFRHNGLKWEYFGPRKHPNLPSPAEFDPIKNDGKIIVKDGALPYDGAPNNPLNANYDPYAEFFDLSDKLYTYDF